MNTLYNSCIRYSSSLIVLLLFLISGIFTSVNSQQVVFGDFGDVKVVNPDGSGLQTIHTFPFDPITRDVATNPTNGIVYILSEQGGSGFNIQEIGTMNIDGTGEYETLIDLGSQFGLGLALDFANEKIYWLEQGSNNRIMRANLDGTGVEELLSSGNNPTVISSSLRNIVVDLFGEKIYWSTAVDANASNLGSIRFADLDGSNPGLLISGKGSNEMESIALHIEAGKIY